MKEMFFSKTQILVPLDFLRSKISLKYIPINIYLFLAHQGDYMKLSSHDFLFHRSLNMRKHKGQIPIIIHHNE